MVRRFPEIWNKIFLLFSPRKLDQINSQCPNPLQWYVLALIFKIKKTIDTFSNLTSIHLFILTLQKVFMEKTREICILLQILENCTIWYQFARIWLCVARGEVSRTQGPQARYGHLKVTFEYKLDSKGSFHLKSYNCNVSTTTTTIKLFWAE